MKACLDVFCPTGNWIEEVVVVAVSVVVVVAAAVVAISPMGTSKMLRMMNSANQTSQSSPTYYLLPPGRLNSSHTKW